MKNLNSLFAVGLALLSGIGLSAACSTGAGSGDDSTSMGGDPHPLLDEPKGAGHENWAGIEVEGPTSSRTKAEYSGEYTPSQADSEYVRCSYGNDPENLGHTRLLVEVGTVGSTPIAVVTLRDFDEPTAQMIEYSVGEGASRLSLTLRTPTPSAPQLGYAFGADAERGSECWIDLVELSAARAEGTVSCADLVENPAVGTSTVAASLSFECDLGDSAPTPGTGGQNGVGGSTGGGPSTGGSGTGGALIVGDGPGDAVTVQEYCEARAKPEAAWCDYIDKCCSVDDMADVNFLFPECTFGPNRGAEDCVASIQTKLAAGSVWDGTWALACAFEMEKDTPSPPSICLGVDMSSWFDQEVSGGAYYDNTQACREMLTANRGLNELCDYGSDCAPELVCNEAETGVFRCAKFSGYAEGCVTTGNCSDGYVCRQEVLDGVCGEPAGEFGACLYTSECEPGMVCHRGNCRTPVPAGGFCDNEDFCEVGYGCSSDGRCVSFSSPGLSCYTSLSCDGRCDATTNQCVNICGGRLY